MTTKTYLKSPSAYLISAAYEDDEKRISSIWVGPFATLVGARGQITQAENGRWWQTRVPEFIDTVDGPAKFLEAFVINPTGWECSG